VLDLVVDTNVVLDLLLFRDPRAVVLREGLASGRYRWIACPPMRTELARVLDRGGFGRWAVDREAVLAAYDGSVVDIDPPASPGTLRCSDGDDQVFIDLAMQRRARRAVDAGSGPAATRGKSTRGWCRGRHSGDVVCGLPPP
jgi:predicted nucleic acid-binding protein